MKDKKYLNDIVVSRIDDVICVDKNNSCGVSITNAAEKICEYLSESNKDNPYSHIIYKDTDGEVDELMFDAQGRFRGFRILRTRNFKDGAKKAKELRKERIEKKDNSEFWRRD